MLDRLEGGNSLSPLATLKVECVESKDSYGRFVAEPLEKGFGSTLGNALRRILLGSLLGAAVTWIRIEGIQHEFATIPYVKEDVTEFMLNVRALRLRPVTKQPGKLFLEAEGAREVYAADIKPSADFEIANPELYLATLDSAESRLYVEFNAMLGKGYLPAASRDNLPIGIIPVDAIFTPVHKVNYLIEPGHAGYEKLILDVWTDGTISVAEAIGRSAEILTEQFSPFTPRFLVPTVESAEKAVQAISAEQREMPLEQLKLSPRVFNCLRRNKIGKVGDLLEKSEQELLTLEKLGQKSLEEVQERLQELGLVLRSEG